MKELLYQTMSDWLGGIEILGLFKKLTVDQVLLTLLLVATVAVAYFEYRRETKWRRLDLLREFARRWSTAIKVPTTIEVIRNTRADFRLQIESEAEFPSALRLLPRKLKNQYERLKKSTLSYAGACNKLYDKVEGECSRRTGLPTARWSSPANEWPATLLLPNFAESVYKRTVGEVSKTEEFSYVIGAYSQSGQGYSRTGFLLSCTSQSRHANGFELAHAKDENVLESVREVHSSMMEEEWDQKAIEHLAQIDRLKDEAEGIARQVREGLNKLAGTSHFGSCPQAKEWSSRK